jgi:hypothetical protein
VAAGQGDSNSTAIALMALIAVGVDTADTKGLVYLRTQQVDDGGFVYSTAWGSTSDPDSDSLVLQALLAAGVDPQAADWSKGSNTVLTAIRVSQGADGGFAGVGSGETPFITSQVPAALMGVPYGAAVHPTAGRSVPLSRCPSPSPSLTASPTATSTPTPATAPPTAPPAPEPTVRSVALATATPTASATETPTASPTESAAAAFAPESTPTAAASGVPAAPGSPAPTGSGGFPVPLVYAIAALTGLAVVAGGGWLLQNRAGRR